VRIKVYFVVYYNAVSLTGKWLCANHGYLWNIHFSNRD